MGLRIAPRHVGDVIDLRGARNATLTVHAPDGLELRIPAPTGKATVWLAQAGRWTYRWPDGTEGHIDVSEAPAVPDSPNATEAQPAPAATYRGQPLGRN